MHGALSPHTARRHPVTFDSTLTELRNQNAARKEHVRQEAAHSRLWSGLGPDPYAPPSMEVLLERAERLSAEREAWMESPRGKLTFALSELRQVGADAEADVVYAAYCRGFKDDREPVNTAEVVRALKALDTLPRVVANDAREALYAILADNENALANVSAFIREARR